MTERLAQIFDFEAARRRRKLPTVEEVRVRQADEMKQRLAEARRKLLREAHRLPRAFALAAQQEIDRVTNDPRGLRGLQDCRDYDITTGTIDGRQVGRPWQYEDACRRALHALRAAIVEWKAAKSEPDRRRVSARRRLLKQRKRDLLVVLFRYGRRRIDHRELEWRSEWDGVSTFRRWREPADRRAHE